MLRPHLHSLLTTSNRHFWCIDFAFKCSLQIFAYIEVDKNNNVLVTKENKPSVFIVRTRKELIDAQKEKRISIHNTYVTNVPDEWKEITMKHFLDYPNAKS